MQESNKLTSLSVLSALGVVYGDIGTSPLYALKESFHHTHELALNQANIYGILSLIFWSLIIVVSVKYLVFILRADNHGEGGILALTALISSFKDKKPKTLRILTLLGIFGTALLYGDGMITPAISVLSAVEGLEYITPAFHVYIIPITVLILIILFSVQKHGTALMGKIFGPVTLCWFLVLGVLGFTQILHSPSILWAANPYHAVEFFHLNAWRGFAVLGSVFLVMTGGEALYSDLGHFGKKPIRWAWFTIVLPCLLLNYFGQGALLLNQPLAIKSPFYLMAPEWALIPLVLLATLSTVIASQALITGVFSITMQAVHLQYIPRVKIVHTSHEEMGQIYVQSVNRLLMLACILLVLVFRTSSNLAAAYGIAVTTTMVITTVLFYFYARHSWNWNPIGAGLLCGFFLLIELSFWGANLLKFVDGGWFPIAIGLLIFTIMTTWHRGRELISLRLAENEKPLSDFLEIISTRKPLRVPGFAVYLTSHFDKIPPTLSTSFEHFHCLHEHIIFLHVHNREFPHVPSDERIELQTLNHGIYQMTVNYGFRDTPDLGQDLLTHIKLGHGLVLDLQKASFFLGTEHILATDREWMAIWREHLFSMMAKNAQSVTSYYQLPNHRIVEIGSRIEI
jgi:KUP system potassium uptake protein